MRKKNVKRIAKKLGANVVERLSDVGGGAFGAMCMAKLKRHHRKMKRG